jgi:bacillolysin
MKKLILLAFLTLSLVCQIAAQKPKDIRNKTQSPSARVIEIQEPADYRKIGVPESPRIFEGTSNIRTLPLLPRPSRALPSGFKVITTEGDLPTMIKGTLPETSSRELPISTRAFQYLDAVKAAMQIKNPSDEFEIKNIETDELGQTHVRMHQKLGNIPVWGSEVILHERNSKIDEVNGFYFPTPELTSSSTTPSVLSTTAKVSQSTAESSVQADLSIKTNFSVLNTDALKMIGGAQFRSELVIFHANDKKNAEKLVWHVSAYPNVLHRYEYFVDAQTNQIIDSYTSSCDLLGHIHKNEINPTKSIVHTNVETSLNSINIPTLLPVMDGASTANAMDLLNQTRVVNTYQVGSTYYLIDASRNMYKSTTSTMPGNPVGVIQTFDNRNTDDGPAYFITSSNNSWSASTKGVSAHYNAGRAFDYFRTTHVRNSINGKGGNISSYINVTDQGDQMDNAYWNGEAMFYGNGKDFFASLPKALDVAGHEISHGVIQNTANLRYQGESGALNESFADIFGAMIDRDDWKMGEDVIVDRTSFPSGALRDLSNPHNGGTKIGDPSYQPQTYTERYTGSQDNGGVHINSGIVNYAFYLFTNNASVGKDKAEKIYYRALTTYLVASSKFIDLRAAIEQSCKDLYPSDVTILTAAQSAFTQVGVGNGGNTTGTAYQQDLPVNPGADWIISVSHDTTKLVLSTSTGLQPTTLYSKGVFSRPSITDDGSTIFFISTDKRMRAVNINWTTGQFDTITIENNPIWNNVAISRDGKKIAANFDDRDSLIWVYSYDTRQSKYFKIYTPTTSQNSTNKNNAKYSDALEWDHFGEYVMYDAFNSISGNLGADIEYWDIGFINVWSNPTKNFASGTVEKLFNNLSENTSIGNPTFAKNSPYVIAFDYIESTTQSDDYYLLATNLQTGDVTTNSTGIYANNTLGVPSYSRTDNRLLFTTEDAAGKNQIRTITLGANKIEPATGNALVKSDAQKGNWFANGKRVLTSTNDLDKTAVSISPNPFNNNISVEVTAEKSGTGSIEIFDLVGRKVINTPLSISIGKNAVSLPTPQLQAGIYLLKITIEGKSLTSKIMKI